MILNLTQHPASPEQMAAGVIDLSPDARVILGEWLTFDRPPTSRDMYERSELIAGAAAGDSKSVEVPDGVMFAMIGGAPYFMSALEAALNYRGITPLYAFSVRESSEQAQPDGSVRKVNSFRHAGFVKR